MQILGLSDSTPHTESRLKSLFWPSIKTANDVEYLGRQGYWVCTVIAAYFFDVLIWGRPFYAIFCLAFYYLGGVGIRQRSSYAASLVLVMQFADTFLNGIHVVRVLILALLLSNLRATWIASRWNADSEEAALPPRLRETWTDVFTDQLPVWLWKKVELSYYVFSTGLLVLDFAAFLLRGRAAFRG
jgi:hypothetical protein